MQIDLIPTLIDQFRETFEGEVRPGVCWITDGRPDSALLGTLAALSAEQAYAPPVPGSKPIAAHVEHLRFTLAVTLERLHGRDPTPDWPSSFTPPPASPAAWDALRRDLRRAYDGVLAFLQQQQRTLPPEKWPPIHLAGLAAVTAHNAYHLGAIRQITRVVGRAQ